VLLEAVSFAPNNRKARELLRKASLKKHEANYPSAGAVAIFGIPKKIGMFFASLGKGSNPEGFMMACERFLTLDPKNKAVNIALGDAAAAANHVDAAIVAYETASEHHPDDIGALKKLGFLLWRNGEISRAHTVFGQAVDLNPKDQEAVKARKNVAAEASLKETGFETAGSSRDLVRDKEETARLEQGTRIHQTDDALTTQLATLSEKLAADPENTDLLQDLAEIYQRQKDWEKSIEVLEKAVAAKPNENSIRFALGDARITKMEQEVYELRRGGHETAAAKEQELYAVQKTELGERVKAYPTDLNLRFRLGEVMMNLGAHDEAIAEFQRTIRDPKFKGESQLRMGQAFAAKGQYDLAVRQLEGALEGHSHVTDRVKEIHYELGGVYAQMGNTQMAREHFGKIYEVDIGFRDVGDRLEKLASSDEEGKLSHD
jgi:tetratricopeptide (TPR) repeat protein